MSVATAVTATAQLNSKTQFFADLDSVYQARSHREAVAAVARLSFTTQGNEEPTHRYEVAWELLPYLPEDVGIALIEKLLLQAGSSGQADVKTMALENALSLVAAQTSIPDFVPSYELRQAAFTGVRRFFKANECAAHVDSFFSPVVAATLVRELTANNVPLYFKLKLIEIIVELGITNAVRPMVALLRRPQITRPASFPLSLWGTHKKHDRVLRPRLVIAAARTDPNNVDLGLYLLGEFPYIGRIDNITLREALMRAFCKTSIDNRHTQEALLRSTMRERSLRLRFLAIRLLSTGDWRANPWKRDHKFLQRRQGYAGLHPSLAGDEEWLKWVTANLPILADYRPNLHTWEDRELAVRQLEYLRFQTLALFTGSAEAARQLIAEAEALDAEPGQGGYILDLVQALSKFQNTDEAKAFLLKEPYKEIYQLLDEWGWLTSK